MSRGTHKNTVAILQARMGSSRLPGKIMAEVADQPMLAVIIKRIRTAKCLDTVVVATTHLPQDDCVETVCGELGVYCFRGSENDCLDRYYQAAQKYQADVVVRLTADNPLVDGEFVDGALQEFFASDPPCDYLSTSLSSYPIGMSVEVFTFNALSTAWKKDSNPQWREHVTPFLSYHPEQFHIVSLKKSPINYSSLRWTVDTGEDLDFVQRIFNSFQDEFFSWREVIPLLRSHPEWLDINKAITQKVI